MLQEIPGNDTGTVRRHRALRMAATLAATAALVISLTVLVVGWWLDFRWLVRILPGHSAMVPSTATCVSLLALAQLISVGTSRAPRDITAGLLAGAVILICLRAMPGIEAADPGQDRMSYATATCLILAAISGRIPAHIGIRQWLTTGGLMISLVAVDSYALDATALQGTPFFAGLSLQTSLCLLLLFLAQILRHPEVGWLEILTGGGSGSVLVRRILPLSVLAPLVFSWGALKSTELGWISPSVRLSVLASLLAFVLVVILLRGAQFQNRMDRERRLNQKRLREILDAIDTAVFVVDEEGRALTTNRKADGMAGPDQDPGDWLRGTAFHALDTREPLPARAHPLQRLVVRKETGSLFAGHVEPGRRELALHFTSAEVDTGSSTLHVISIADETEGWILRENLARRERFDAIGQLAGGISHEISNILGVIRISADTGLMKRRFSDVDYSLETIRDACGRGATLVNRLMTMTSDGGKAMGKTDLSALVEQTVELVRASVPRQFALTLELPPDQVFVAADGTDMETSLLNLVLNAKNVMLEAGQESGTIRVQVETGDRNARLRVTDDGPGMSDEVRRRACDPFYTTREKNGGTGLGLSMVNSFAQRVEGGFELRSVPGVGTECILTLPLATAPHPVEPEGFAAIDLTGMSVLVVEADPQTLHVLSDVLQFMGARTHTASGATEALKVMHSHAPVTLLVVNARLDGAANGYVLATRCVEIQPDLRVIYMSGYTDELNRADRKVPGLMLRKPLSVEKLQNTIMLTLRN